MNSHLDQLRSLFRNPETPGSYFFSLEGIEGSGKSTQIKHLSQALIHKGYKVLTLREPGGTVFGEKLREAILAGKEPLHPLAEAHLFASARAQLLKEKILPFLLNPGSVVILDRYIDSSLAYQGKARGLGYETILEIHAHDPLCLMPHRTFFLDIDLETSMGRQEHRSQAKDYFESEKVEFYTALMDGYRELATIFPDRIVRIDASAPEETVSKIIQHDLARLLT